MLRSRAIVLCLCAALPAQRLAYDEFDGATRAGFAQPGIGEWASDGAREHDGALHTERGNSWRALAAPVVQQTVWYAVTLRMAAPIEGYASVVPAWSAGSQFSELGFNTGFGDRQGLWTAGRAVKTGLECTQQQTFLQRYDLVDGRWSAWVAPGLGASLLDAADQVTATPAVRDAALGADTLSHLYLTKGSPQTLQIERVAVALTARDALTPARRGDAVQAPPAPARVELPVELAALLGGDSPLRAGERIACLGDSLTWQGGYIELLERACARHRPDLHITWLRRGLDGAKSYDLLAGKPAADGTRAPTLAQVLERDRPTLVSILIGINDVWWPDARTGHEAYAANLRELVAQAQAQGCGVVLCTPTIVGELPSGQNQLDADLDAYAAIVREVAAATGAALCDLRAAFVAALAAPREAPADRGLLTYDGVHMLPRGNQLIAHALAAALARAAQPRAVPELTLLPWPRAVQSGRRRLMLPQPTRVFTPPELHDAAELLTTNLRATTGIALTSAPDAASAQFVFELDAGLATAAETSRERYRVTTDELARQVRVQAASPLAALRAVATLTLSAEATPIGIGLPTLQLDDAPELAFRALLVDVARQPHGVATLEQLIELCSLYKVGYLQLHLTDDQAFTFPSRAFPRLVTPKQHYTREQLGQLVEFARRRGVVLIPELEMPGHAGAMVAAMPERFQAHRLHHATLDFAKPEVLAALDALLAEVAEVFTTSPYLHIGGDEADLAHVHETPSFQAAFAREGVKDAHALYVKFLARMNETVKRLGKRTLVWEGFGPDVGAQVPKDITVVAYEAAYYVPDQLVADGFQIVNAAWQPLYVVNDRCWPPAEIQAWNPWLFLHFLPSMPAYRGIQLAPTAAVQGAMLCAWEQPEARELPSLRQRLAAFSERVWTPRHRAAPAEFAARAARADAVLERLLRR